MKRGCIDCGFNNHPAALHFDHRDPLNKSFSVARNSERSWKKVLEEVDKCDVRCANCHAIKHANELRIIRLRKSGEMVAARVC